MELVATGDLGVLLIWKMPNRFLDWMRKINCWAFYMLAFPKDGQKGDGKEKARGPD